MIVKNALTAFSGEKDFRKCDIQIKNEKITAISQNLTYEDDDIMDAEGLYLFPGGIDPHVHFYDPGYTQKEDFYAGTSAAAKGGITSIIDMPCTSIPPVTNVENLHTKLDVVKEKAVIDFAFHGGLSRQTFDAGYEADMEGLADYVMGFKAYLVSGMSSYGSFDYFRLQRLFRKAKELNRPVLLHTEDASLVYTATEYWQKQGKRPMDYYNSRPELAEILAVESVVRLAEEEDADVHIVHIGTAEAAERLYASAVTGETCPQYLAFSLQDFLSQGPLLKIAPSIKQGYNCDELWKLLADGILDFVASDHAPGTKEEKSGDDIWKNSSGIAGVETMLPYIFSEGLMKKRLGLNRYLEVMSENAAKRFGFFDRKGSIAVGKDADLVLIDPKKGWTVKGSELLSKATATPYENMHLQGRVEATLVRGQIVYKNLNQILVEPGYGRFFAKSL